MIAEALKDEYFSFEEIARVLRVKPQTLRTRIYTGTEHPPYHKVMGQYVFPKREFRDWVAARPLIREVRSVG